MLLKYIPWPTLSMPWYVPSPPFVCSMLFQTFNLPFSTYNNPSFQTGDSIAILRNIDAEWLEGKLGEKTGIFPITFVSFPGGDGDAGAAAAGFELVASFDYEGEQDDELSFSKGDVIVAAQTVDSDWFQGSFDGKQGIFPSAYVAWASALYDYEGAESDELSFVQGDRVNLNERIDDGT